MQTVMRRVSSKSASCANVAHQNALLASPDFENAAHSPTGKTRTHVSKLPSRACTGALTRAPNGDDAGAILAQIIKASMVVGAAQLRTPVSCQSCCMIKYIC